MNKMKSLWPPTEENQKRLRVAIDFDSTITLDEESWANIIRMMQLAGWEPSIVTWRPSSVDQEINEFIGTLAVPIPVVFCNGCAKRECFDADIWIDDNPSSVLFSLGRAPSFKTDYGDEHLILSSDPSISIDNRKLRATRSKSHATGLDAGVSN